MRKPGLLIAIAALHGTAAAQPGGSDLPIDGAVPAAHSEAPPPMQAEPQPQPQPPPQPATQVLDPATAPTRATFVSDAEAQWDVYVDQQAICSTPCTLGLSSMNFVALRTQENQPVRLDVGNMPQGDLMIRATPLRNGMYAGGIVMTTFAGMALVTGVTLTAVGWGTGRDGMRTAGLITAVPGAVGLYAGIYLMRKALPRFTIGGAQPYVTGQQVGFARSF